MKPQPSEARACSAPNSARSAAACCSAPPPSAPARWPRACCRAAPADAVSATPKQRRRHGGGGYRESRTRQALLRDHAHLIRALRRHHVAHAQVSDAARLAARSRRRPWSSSLARGLSRAMPTMDRRAFLRRSGLGVGVGLAAGAADAGAQGAGGRGAPKADGARQDRGQAHRLHPLLGRLRDRRGGRERRLGAPGAGVRFADQPRRALRQGRGAARARPRRVPAEVPDEARRRQVPAHQLGPGAQRDQRQDARAAQGRAGPDSIFSVGSSQAQQRAGVPAAQVGQPLGQQQLRPPGAHLPLDHGRRRSQHLGLRRDDQFVQRHAELASARCTSAPTRPRRTRCRCCTCCMPRKPAAR